MYHASFSHDGKFIATASNDQMARIWDAQTGRLSVAPMWHEAIVFRTAWSPDDRRLMTACQDGTARLWSTDTGERIPLSMRHGGPVVAVSFAPDGRGALTIGGGLGEREARVWDVSTVKPVRPLIRSDAPLWSASFREQGECVVLVGTDGKARAWSAKRNEPLGPTIGTGSLIRLADASPDCRCMATIDAEETAELWDIATGSLILATPKELDVSMTAFSPDGGRLLTVGRDKSVRVWSTRTGAPLTPPLMHQFPVEHAAFGPEGRLLVTATGDWSGAAAGGERGEAMVWDIEEGKQAFAPLEHKGGVHFAAFSPDGTLLVTSGAHYGGGETSLWDARNGKLLRRVEHGGIVVKAVFDPKGTRIVTCSSMLPLGTGVARVWDVKTGQPISPPMSHHGPVVDACFSPQGDRVFTVSTHVSHGSSIVHVWDPRSGEPITPPLEQAGVQVRRIEFADDDRVVAAIDGHAWSWTLVDEGRPIDDVVEICQLLADQRIDETGSPTPLGLDNVRRVWSSLRARYPKQFGWSK